MGRTRQAEAAISNLKEKEVIPKIIKNKLKFFFFSVIAFLLLIVLIFAIISPTKLTGFFTGDSKENLQTFSQNVNLDLNQSTIYEWILENPGQLNSVKLNGLIELKNNSEVKIYLDELLIFDSSKIKKKSSSVSKITGEVIDGTSNIETTTTPEKSTESQESYSETETPLQEESSPSQEESLTENTSPESEDTVEEIQITKTSTEIIESQESYSETETPLQEESSPSQEESLTENQTDETNQEKNKTEINETSNSNQFNESYSETETPLQEESSPSQEESLTENQTDENLEILEFSNICEETCNLEKLNLNNSSYNLRIEISGNATLTLESFDYEIFEQIQEIQINLSQEINTTQYPAILGEPVKWKKLISNPENNSIKVELPKEAENISVNKVTYKKNQFNESYSETETPLQEESSPSQEESLTENIKKEKINTKIEKISKKEKGDTKEYLEISIEDNASFYEIEYQTPAPQAIEEKLSNGKKVKVTSPDEVHYENILAYTELEENLSINDASQIQIFWIEQNTSIPIEKIEDRNLNGIYDYVEWIIPHLSNQTFLITIQPDSSKGKDTYIDEASINRNYGVSTVLIVNAVDRRRSLIEFDLSEITSTANIINANLTLYLASKGTGSSIPINIYRINSSWTEGIGNDQITANGATWNNRSGNESWISAGGDFNPTLIATYNVSSENTFYTWDLTELVKNWINGTYPNYGIIIRAGSGDGIWQFSSSEDSNTTRRPQLNITYNESTVPVINSVNMPLTIREGENVSLTANITDNLEVANVSIEINNENYSLGQNPQIVSNNIIIHPILKGTIEANQVINYQNTYDNNNDTYAGINNVNPVLTVKTAGASATGTINSVKIKIVHSKLTYDTIGYVHWASSNGGEVHGLTHEFNSTSEIPTLTEFDVTSERNWSFQDLNLLTEVHINNSDSTLRIYEAWLEVNYTTPASNDLWNATINTSLFSSGNYTYTIFSNDSSQNIGIYKGNLTILPPLVLMNVSMNDAQGNFQESEVIIYNAKNQEIEMNSSMTESQLISLEEGEKDIIIIPADTTITQIEYENTTIEEYVEAIIDIDHPEESGNFTTIYALNPYLETNATVKVVATGNELYKCKDWNFSEQNCFGEWIKVMDIIPGEEYNFTLNPEDPGFGEIILITKAEHLSSNKTFISDIYNEIRGLDNIWSETISEDEYIRITFEIPLDSTKDITLYPRIVSGNPRIEVYEFNGTNLIAEFNPIEDNRYNTIYLTNLIGEQSTFDLRIVDGSLEFDHILDPSIWVKDLAINASLPDAGSNSTPSVFYKDSSWYILNGNLAGTFNGYVWNGTNWLVNTTINRTLVDIGANSHPSVFYISPTWYFISGMTTGRLYTYQWNGTAFEMNKTMNISLPDLGSNTAPTVFYKDSSWYLISGELGGRFFGYVWNGSSFVKNLTINNSLPDIGALSKPNVFQKDGVYYMLAGESNGEFKGFAWDGTKWLPNSTINSSLPDIGGFSTPNVFYKDSAWYMISGENLGRFFGYNYSSDETPPFYSSVSSNNTMLDSITLFSVNVNDNYILNPNGGYIFSTNNTGSWVNDSFVSFSSTPSWANVSKILNSTLGTVIGYMWYFNDSAGNTNSTLIYTLTTTEYELQCGILNSADTIYTLTQNLSSTGDCFNIAAVNITLDCDGYSIIGNNNQGAKAINVGTPNATIKNCILKNWSTDLYVENTENTTIKNITGGSEYGLIVNGTSNSNFTDLSFNNISITGILITNNSHNNTFTNIRINSSAHGIYLESGQNNTFDCANGLINYSRNGSNYFYGIYTNQFNTTIKNCNVLDGNLGSSGTERHGVYLYTSTYSTLSNCFILGNNSPTISLNEAHFSSIINNTGISGNRAIHLLDTNNTLIKNNTGNSTLNNPGIHVYGTCSNNTFINNTVLSREYSLFLESNYPTKGTSNNLLINNTLTSTQSTALMFSGSNNNTIINQIAESKAAYAIDLASSANNTFRDCINLTGASQEISLGWDSGSFNNTLINCSYGQEYIPVIENWMLIKWYYQAYVNYSNGNPASNVNITAYNSSGNIEFTAQTNSSGWISRQEVRDYNSTYNGRLYYSNYTLFANKSGTLNDTNILNISLSPNKLNDFFTLEQAGVQCGDSLDIAGNTYTLTSNISSQGTCFDISTDNITLDCNGYWINYSIGGEANTYGVYSYDTTNLTIKNCNIVDGNWSSTTQYSRVGININTVTNSTIFNNTIRANNSYGIYLYNNAKYNNLTANTVFSNTSLGIILDDNSADNTLIDNTASSNGDAAIFLYQYSDNNTLIGNNGTSRFAGCFIYLSGYNNLSNNTCQNIAGTDYGLYLYDAYNNLFVNNTAISEFGTATNLGISLNNTFIKHTSIVSGTGYQGISLDYNTNNTIIRDCINISGFEEDVSSNSNSINNTFINCSYDNTESIDDASSQLIRKWYYQAYANNTGGSPVNNANISAYNTTGQLQFTELTNSTGYISRQEVTEYINTGGTRSYYSNYTIFANKSTALSNDSNMLNITATLNKLDDVFTLTEEAAGPADCTTIGNSGIIDTENTYTLTENISSSGTCLYIRAANVTLDCAGYWINFSTGGINNTYGIDTNQFNTTVKNCNIVTGNQTIGLGDDGRVGIYFVGADNGTILNNSVTIGYTSSRGIHLEGSADFNNIINNTAIVGYHAIDIQGNYTIIINNLANSSVDYYPWASPIILYGASNTYLENNTAKGIYQGVYFGNGAKNNIFRNFQEISGNNDVYIDNTVGNINNSFVNCSYNTEFIESSTGEIIRKWYYQAYTNYSNGTEVAGANITAYDLLNDIQFTTLTNSSGLIDRQEVTEYVNTGGTRTYYNNYTINATLSGYDTDSNVFNFTTTQNKIDDVFTLIEEGEDTTPPTISFELPTPANASTVYSPNQTIVANISDNSAGNTSSWVDFDRSLISYWSMDYYNATGIYDNSTYGNNGTFQGGLNYSNLTIGTRGNAITLDGESDYLSTNNIIDMGQHITLSLWSNIRGNSSSSDSGLFFEHYNWGSEGGDGFGIYQYFVAAEGESGMYTYARIANYSTSWNEVGANIEFAPLNTWRNYVIVFDFPYVITYVNGELSDNVYFPYTLNSTWNDISIGRLWEGVYFNGSLDEVMIFNRSLSNTEILALYNSQSNKFNITFTNLSLGQHNYTVYAIDGAGNINNSGQRNFIVEPDTTPPNVTINFPTGTIADVTPLINISSTETGTIWYNIDNGTNITLCTSCNTSQNTFLYLEEGTYTLYAFANDTSGNLNNTVSSQFTLNMANNYYDNFNDNSSIQTNSNLDLNSGNISFTGSSNYLDNPNLVSVYEFESSGNLGLDTKGNNNMSSVGDPAQNTTVPSGFTGYSIQLDGDDQVCNYSGFTFNASQNHTMCFWVMKTVFANDGNVFAQNCVYDTWDASSEYIFTANNCYNQESVGIEGVYFLNQWVHICQTYNSENNNMTFFINGAENRSHVFSGNPIQYHADQAWCIGGCNGGCWMTGNVFQPMWFNKTLTSDQIFSIYSKDAGYNLGNFTSYPINTTQNITTITNITWTELNTNTNNNITVQVSVDGGINWYTATSGSALGKTFTGENNSLVYRVLFFTNSTTTIAISDMNISWSNEEPAEPDTTSPTITFEEPPTPTNGSTITISNITIVANISDNSSGNTSSWIDFDRSLIAYWSMDYYNATGIYDNSTYNNFGEFIGGLNYSNLTAGKRGNALEFHKTGDYLNTSKIKLNHSFTTTLWFRTSDPSPGYANLIGDYDSSSGDEGWTIRFNNGVNGVFNAGSDCGILSDSICPSCNDGNWHFVAVILNNTGSVSVYDGVFGSLINFNGCNLTDSNYTITLGANDEGLSQFNGSLDEVMIFNRTLSREEVLALYNSKSNKFNATFNNLTEGKHNYTVYAIDENGNYNSSGERNFIFEEQVVGKNLCGTLDSANTIYTLTENISSQGTCLTIDADNITLDCNNYWINYSINGSAGANAIYSYYNNNLTIRNCNIIDGNWTSPNEDRMAINIYETDDSTLFNNYINTSNSNAVYWQGPTSLNLSSNRFYSNSTTALNFMYSCSDIYLFNNTLESSFGEYSLVISGERNSILSNNIFADNGNRGCSLAVSNSNITNNTITTSGAFGVYFSGDNNTIRENTISAESASLGLYYSNFNNTISYNNITSTGGAAISLYAGGESNSHNVITENIINGDNTGISLSNSNSNLIEYNNITATTYGILITESNNNTVRNTNVTSITLSSSYNNALIANRVSGGNSAYYLIGSNYTNISDCVEITSNFYDILISSDSGSINNVFLNCSFDEEKIAIDSVDGEIIRKWYYQAYTNYSNGTAIENANISAYNTTGQLQFTTLTNSSGYISRQEVTEYINTGGTRSYYNNYTINATLTGYITESNIFNFTSTQNKLDDVFTLDEEQVVGENACGTLDSANTVYTLTSNVSSSGTCFTITQPNITLDCNNYWINYSLGGAANTYGIYSDKFNATIKNCNIYDGNWTSPNTDRYGIYIYTGDNSTLFNNYINTNNSAAITLDENANDNNLTQNIINTNFINYGWGIYLDSVSSYNNINNNTINSGSNGVFFIGSSFNNIINNNATSRFASGIFIQQSSNNNTLINNTFESIATTGSSTYGVRDVNNFNNTYINNTAKSVGRSAIIISGSSNLTFISHSSTTSGPSGTRYGIWFYSGNNTVFRDCRDISGGTADVNVVDIEINLNNTLINCSYSSEIVGGTSNYLIRKWYYQAYTNYSNGTAIENANISAYNTTGQLQFTTLTNSSGYISRQEVTEYINTGGTRSYYNNYTINATLTGYITESNIFNFTSTQNKLNDVFTLTENQIPGENTCGTLDSANTLYTLTSNVSSSGTCFTISAENITLDCNGFWINYSINGTESQYGIYSNQLNTTIKNCNIVDGNWTSVETGRYGIAYQKSDNSTIYNNFINTSNSNAIDVRDGTYYNNISLNRIHSLSGNGIYLYGATNYNNLINNSCTSNSSIGIYISTFSSYNNLTNNIVSSNTMPGVSLASDANNNLLINNTMNSNSSAGIDLSGVFNNTLIDNVGFSTANSGAAPGLNMDSGSSNNLLISNNFTSGVWGIYLGEASNNLIRDCIQLHGTSTDIYNNYAVSSNISFINCSYDTETILNAESTLIRKWYFDANVSYSNNTAIENANLTLYNSSSTFIYSELTNSTGDISKQEVTEYINTGGTRTYQTPHIVNVTKAGYLTNSTIYNLTNLQNIFVNIILEENNLPQIYSITPLTPVTLTEGPAPTFLIVNFSVYDANGASNLNSSTASINFTKAGEELRYNNSCIQYQSSGNYANYTCNVTLWWFDAAGNDWKIYVNISDLNSNIAVNNTLNFTVNTLTGFVADYSSLNFATLVAGSNNQTPVNHFKLNNTGNVDISIGNIEINATDLVGETTHDRFLFAGNFSASPYTGNKIECSLNGSSTQLSNYTFTKVANTLLPSGNYTLNDGTAQEEIYLCLREIGIELTQQQYSTDSFGSWTIRIVLVALSIRTRKKKSKSQKISQLTIPATIFTKKLGALESTVKYMKENLGLTYHTIAEMLNRNERTIWTAYNKSIEKYKETIEVKETEIFIPLSILNNRKLTILESVIVYLRNKDMTYSEISKLIDRDQRNVRSIYVGLEQRLKEKQTIISQLTIPATIFTKKLGALESTVKYMKENLGLTYHTIAEMLNRDERTIWTAYNKSIEKYKETIEVKETEIFIPLSILNNRKLTILESVIVYLRNKDMTYSEISKLIDRDQRNVRDIYFKENNNI